jgi:predicted transcriptional regulator
MHSFRAWLEHRPQQVPDAATLALVIARSGAAGVSREEMARALGVPGETVESLLRAMLVSGQVVVLKRDDQLVYRAMG